MSKDGLFSVGGPRRDVSFLAGVSVAIAAGLHLAASATSRKQNLPASGTSNGTAAAHRDQMNADLLAFISDHDDASSAIPWRSQ
jgi:hypothetical protein